MNLGSWTTRVKRLSGFAARLTAESYPMFSPSRRQCDFGQSLEIGGSLNQAERLLSHARRAEHRTEDARRPRAQSERPLDSRGYSHLQVADSAMPPLPLTPT